MMKTLKMREMSMAYGRVNYYPCIWACVVLCNEAN